ncbi:hypothetical protein [Streptomyces sp. NBC_01527]|uniref:hypothetical protein n=1 Tax=Streptomyces sp. NBC_01527 TaxID=2903894 RepID=UPI0038646A1E
MGPDLVLARLVGDRTHGWGDPGEVIKESRTADPSQDLENDNRTPCAVTAVPAATPRTSMVAMTTVRRRRGRELFPFGRVAKSSGKLWRPMSVVRLLDDEQGNGGPHHHQWWSPLGRSSMIFVPAFETLAGRGAG